MADLLSRISAYYSELRRRNVLRVVAVYAAAAFVGVQVAALVVNGLRLPHAVYAAVVMLAILGFPLAVAFAWYFEYTPEGLRRTPEEDPRPGEVVRVRGSPWTASTFVALVLVATAAAGWVGWQTWIAPAGDSPSPAPEVAAAPGGDTLEEEQPNATRIAVLCFDDYSQGRELDHVAKGLTEALIHHLAKVEGLTVLSRNAVQPYCDRDVPLDTLARKLRVGSVVEGSVEGSGDRLRATVQLADTRTLDHIMSEVVDREGTSALALRDSVATEAVRLLRKALGEEIRVERTRAGTESDEAWKAFHRADIWMEDADELGLSGEAEAARRLYRRADDLFARARNLDSGWAAPLVARGRVALAMGRLGGPSLRSADPAALRRSIAFADSALALSGENARALELRGEARYFLNQTLDDEAPSQMLDAAVEDLRRAVDADPSLAAAWARLSFLLQDQGRFAEARRAARRSREADAFLANDRDNLYLAAQLALEFEEIDRARRLVNEGLRLFPEEPAYMNLKLLILASEGGPTGRVQEAWELQQQVASRFPDEDWPSGELLVAAVLAREGLTDSARSVMRRVRARAPGNPYTYYYAAKIHLHLGEQERAIDNLAGYLEEKPSRRSYIAHDWWWKSLRGDPRFQELVSSRADTTAPVGRADPASGGGTR